MNEVFDELLSLFVKILVGFQPGSWHSGNPSRWSILFVLCISGCLGLASMDGLSTTLLYKHARYLRLKR